MLTVACVLSEGPKRTYNRTHVTRLEDMVAGYLKQPYRFVCLDDSPFPGWWAKISLFEPGRFKGRVLYLDLDVTITGNLDELADYPASFVAIDDWLRPTLNSSVMAWNAGIANHIFMNFTNHDMAGDQDFITEQMPDAKTYPSSWCVSYRKHVQMFRTVPLEAKVIVYHGFPKPWQI